MKISRSSALAVIVGFVFTIAISAHADLKLAAIFGDNMVLQQQMAVPIWGWTASNMEVTVTFAGQTKTTRTGADGKWLVKLGKLKASSEPQTMMIAVEFKPNVGAWNGPVPFPETKTLTNILVGEVWLASGQSNMEKPIGKQQGQSPTFNAEQELAVANYPNIRIFKVEKKLAAAPLADLAKFNTWQECSSNSLDGMSFSAAAYFFGREIYTNLNMPVGLVESAWGGTRIEPWTPPAGFEQVESQKKFAATKIEAADVPDKIKKFTPKKPTVIYNAMIAPVVGFAMHGVIWYQGESNLMGTNENNDYLEYPDKMAALVGGWRKIWGEGDFPFYFVQIAPFKYYGYTPRFANSPEMLPEFWTLQSLAARRIKNTGMAVTTDLVNDVNDIHPRDKLNVGHRLALLALNKTYGEKNLVCNGPVFAKMKISGDKALLKFDHADGGLMSKDGQSLTCFTIASADGKFVSADAKIVGDAVEVFAAEIEKPVAVRFAWAETAQPNFCNAAGLPAEPFRTDAPTK